MPRRARARIPALSLLALVLAGPAHAADGAEDLPAAIAAALAHAPGVAEADADTRAASARLDGARAESMPQISIAGEVGEARLNNGGFFGFTAQNVTPLAVTATAEMPLYAGGRVAAAIDQARFGRDIAKYALADTRARTVVAAVAAYAEVLTARRIEARWQQTTGELTEVERQAGLRFKAGEIPQSDLSTATARRAEGIAGMAAAQGRRAAAEAQYRRLTGRQPGALAPLPPLPQTPPTLDEAVDSAHRQNPALAEAEHGIDVARAAVRGAKAESLPVIGTYAEASRTRDQFFPGYRADVVSVGLRGRWTLFAGGRTAAKIHEADAGLDASEARARDARDAVDTAVIDAWSALHTATAMVAAGHARALAAAEALRSTRLEAQVAEKPTLAVLDAEREATGADAAAIEAEGQQLVAAWQLNELTGASDN